ncbi:MAG: shikimate dehydrogenase [Alphaproteobacteria bacterium]|nr:shikimate dehydrogenase [Alphaproteobacteria bacterium]
MKTNISGKTRLAGVIGWPVTHSLSPAIHNHWLAEHGLDVVYVPLPINPAVLHSTLPSLGEIGVVGVNLTLPHKELVIPVLDVIDHTAQAIGAVNTVLFDKGQRIGFNTDAYGFWHNIEVNAPQVRRDEAFVIGAGGAARAVVAALDAAGYQKIHVMNRSPEKIQGFSLISPRVVAHHWSAAPEVLANVDLLVNTTSLGMGGQPALDISLDALPSHAVVNDIVYTPLDTPLLHAARRCDLATVDGLGMLLYQAQKAFEIWFGILPEVTPELRLKVLG